MVVCLERGKVVLNTLVLFDILLELAYVLLLSLTKSALCRGQ